MRTLLITIASLLFGSFALIAADLEYAEVHVPINGKTIRVDLCIFNPERHHLRVLDNRSPVGIPRTERIAYAMKYGHYAAAINGGFYHVPEFQPVGLMISHGESTGEIDQVPWLKGIILVDNGKPALINRDDYKHSETTTELLQSGPWLIQNEQAATEGIGEGRIASRTFVAEGTDGRWVLGVTDIATLGQLVGLLQSGEIEEKIKIKNALNMDGGPSTGFWMRAPNGQIVSRPEANPIRNYLAISRQPPPLADPD